MAKQAKAKKTGMSPRKYQPPVKIDLPFGDAVTGLLGVKPRQPKKKPAAKKSARRKK